ncbi:MAG: patatin-like phospholipase family protein, partial [Acidimicrobiia bacterium]
KQEIVAEVVPGETVGELALLIDQPRAATVFAARDSTLGRLPRRVFDLIGSRYPQTMLEVTSSILRRLRTSDVRRRGALRLSVAVLPATNDSGVRHFAVDLARALGDVGTTYQLTRERIDEILGKPGIASASADEPAAIRLGEWLGEVEDRFEVVVYECDPEWTPWTERAIGHADLVLTVIDARAGPSLQPVEATLAETLDGKRHARRALVILHEASASPHRTGRWLDLRDVDDHFHVEMGARDDLARIARILSGRGLGVALGGGGARGLAHIGVLRCFEELHLPIDLIGGTSMGSVMGSLRALGLDHTQMTEVVKESFADTLDYTMPVVSLVKGRRATDSMRAVFGSRGIEDLTIPFFCISTNITRSRTVVHRVGDLTTAVRASGALPGVFPPVPFDGNLLVDGGVLNNLPADVVRRSTPDGRVVAVNVAPSVWSRARSDFGLSVSGFRALMDRLNPRRRPVAPPITSTLLRSMVVGSMRDRDLLIDGGVADLYLDLDLRGVGMLDFDAVDRVAATAYEAAMPQFEAWLERDPEVANLAGG